MELNRTAERAREWAHARRQDPAVWVPHVTTPERHEALAAGTTPTLGLEDVSGIPFVSVIPGVEMYQHRARVRARTGDLFVASTPVAQGYEAYNLSHLDLGAPEFVLAEPADNPAACTSACLQPTNYARIAAWAKRHPVVAVHPYMAIESVWELAAKLSRDTGVETHVVGPTPDALWVANDKWALTDLIRTVAGPHLVVESSADRNVDTIVHHLAAFARRHPSVGIKRTRCASAMGNIVFDSHTLLHLSDLELRQVVRDFLRRTEWNGHEDVLVVEWVRTDVSPSTQTWIPPRGSVRMDGVYEQILKGREKVFVGSRPSTLPPAVNEALTVASMTVATALQSLGYVGRCSFDFVVEGDLNGTFQVKITECNGRWGGTSTPMHLVDRVLGTGFGTRPHYIAQDYVHPALVGAEFVDVRDALSRDLYRHDTRQGRYLLYNVGPLEKSGKFDVVSLGRTPEEAQEGIERLGTLLGL